MAEGESTRYSDHLDTLTALITYLGLCAWRSRSPHGLARDLGLDATAVEECLLAFPGIFRKSATPIATDVGPQPSFTLHARYARRRPRSPAGDLKPSPTPSGPQPEQDGRGEELEVDVLKALLEFVAAQARLEVEGGRATLAQRGVMVGVGVAAAAAILSSVLQVAFKGG